jgi:hypothetical protein
LKLASRQLIECRLIALTTNERPSIATNIQNNVQGQFSLSSGYGTTETVTSYATNATVIATSNTAFTTVYDNAVFGLTISGSSLVNPTFVVSSGSTDSLILVVELGLDSDTFALQISDKIASQIGDDALRLMVADRRVSYHTGALCDDVERELRELGVKYSYKITTFSEPESTGHRMLVVEFLIENKEYDEVLTIWNDITRRTFSKLPLDVRKKVALVMDR